MGTFSSKELIEKIKQGDRFALSRAITLAESRLPDHQEQSLEILDACFGYNTNTLRIGITGVPGVGKSTFIDTFGSYLITLGFKVAVLAIDPTSQQSHGSILGDKTRMEQLVNHDNAFIRPSPARDSLGGVERATRKSVILCEAAGFDIILVETVGVGQSETEVADMVDFFLLLMQPGTGDELQGIKRGIIEMADGIFINKADILPREVDRSKADYASALHLMPPRMDGWAPFVMGGSAVANQNIHQCWEKIEEFNKQSKQLGRFESHRKDQYNHWLESALKHDLYAHFLQQDHFKKALVDKKQRIADHEITPFRATNELLRALFSQLS